MNITDEIIRIVYGIADCPLSEEVVHQVKRCLLDYIGVTYAGRQSLYKKLTAFDELVGTGCCSVIASDKKADLITASMMNGISAHIHELDDGQRIGAPHLEAVIISAMIGIAQNNKISFEKFIKGILIGYEITIRLSAAMQPSLKLKGFHSTGVCGTIGIACAVGYALGLNRNQLKGAVSASATSAAGILQVLDDNSELKPYNVANAIQSGITSVFMGKCNYQGPDDVLGGKRGYLRAHSDNVNLEYLLGKKERLEIFQIYVKPYASCRHSHSAVDCALKLRKKNRFEINDINDIEIQTYKLGIFTHDSIEVSSISAAKMSTPYCVASALVSGDCGIDAFSETAVRKKETQQLMQKVRVIENENLTKLYPQKRGATVIITLKNGLVFSESVEMPLGDPENNISDTQLEEKYDSLMSYSNVKNDESEKLKRLIWNLEDNYDSFISSI